MISKLEITIDVIVHATEDVSRFFTMFEEILGIKQEQFSTQNLTGHYDNPITIIRGKLQKKEAREFITRLMKTFDDEQRLEILDNLEDRLENSTLHLRLDKQSLIIGKMKFKDKDAIKLKIATPIYKKEDTSKIFTEILEISN